MKDQFRCLIAALYGKTAGYANNKTVVLDTDVALRCAFYGNAQLTSKEMHEGRERDPAAFEFAVLFNDHVYLKPKLRKLLEEEYVYPNDRPCKRFRILVSMCPSSEYLRQKAA